jgi:phage tail sheath protein FI
MLPHSVYGFFNNGGGNCYIVRIPHQTMPQLALGTSEDAKMPALSITSTADLPGLEVTVEASEDEEGTFDVTISREGEELETFSGLTLGSGPTNAATIINDASAYVSVKTQPELEDVIAAPATGTFPLAPTAPVPLDVSGSAFEGREAERTGIRGLVIADEATMLIVPDLVTATTNEDGTIDLDKWKGVQLAMIAHCEQQANRLAVLDPPPDMSPQQIKEWRSDVAMYDSKFAVMYYPWITVANPVGNGSGKINVPPSGHLAGIWARNDGVRGVWKAPANEVVTGALDVATKITKGEQATLNPIGVNCIRPFGTRGIRVWGARTLSSDPSWVYVNVRRLFNMIESSIMEGTQWVVFEPNDQALWQRVKRTISAFLLGLWREGALFGATPDEAFYVKCDSETNPPDSIDLGRLVVEVGIAPVKPAEFVIFRISQWAGGAASAE